MKKSSAYSKLAPVYSHIMKKVSYEDWADYIYAVSNEYFKGRPTVLELAGGNAKLAEVLSLYYPGIIVTDLSKYMLFENKARKLKKVCCDMTQLPFKAQFDIVYSTFDSINYITSSRKLLKVFTEVRDILSDRGIFTFDASLERNSYIHIQQPIRKGKYNNISYEHQTTYDGIRRIHKNIFKIQFEDGLKYREIHKQKIYPFEEYFKLFEKAGLYVIECYEAFSFKNAKASSVRAQFVVSKI